MCSSSENSKGFYNWVVVKKVCKSTHYFSTFRKYFVPIVNRAVKLCDLHKLRNYHARISYFYERMNFGSWIMTGYALLKKEICPLALIFTHLLLLAKNEIRPSVLIFTHPLLHMNQIAQLNNYCPGNFLAATLTISRPLPR